MTVLSDNDLAEKNKSLDFKQGQISMYYLLKPYTIFISALRNLAPTQFHLFMSGEVYIKEEILKSLDLLYMLQ